MTWCRNALLICIGHFIAPFTAYPHCPRPSAHSGFNGGNVTFVYTITDGVTPVTATVTLTIAPPADLSPALYSYTAPFNQNFSGPSSVLDDVVSTNPNPQLEVVELTTVPNPATVGSVEINPDGTYVFTPVDGWFGEWQPRALGM